MATVWELPLSSWAIVVAVMLTGGVVRGFGGFGASMVWVTGLSLVIAPAAAIPTALILEVLASLQLLPSVWSQAHWASLRWLLVGVLIGLPFGTWALVWAPDTLMRLLIGVAVITATIVMALKVSAAALPGRAGTVAVGTVSGALNGAFAMGGPPAILMYFSSSAHAAAGRASLIVFFLCTDTLGIASASLGGLVTVPLLLQVLALFPASLIGVGVGSWWYRRTATVHFQRYVLWLLAALSCLVVGQVVWTSTR